MPPTGRWRSSSASSTGWSREAVAEADAIRAGGAGARRARRVGRRSPCWPSSENYARPVVDGSRSPSAIEGGRHPVVEQALGGRRPRPSSPMTATCRRQTDGEHGAIWLVTGPNMAGKSTFLRQNALIAILAQTGSFVPAASAHIGVVDRLFSRVGASDDLARGRSTFMVEMVETAAILNQAGERALVILDEIGRGTATFDGLSIAWAAVEHLHENNRCRALFATHYHELTALAGKLPRLHNVTMRVKEWEGDVVFLHEVAPGAADRSYGIQVARLAGLPAAVVQRAKDVLHQLENRRNVRQGRPPGRRSAAVFRRRPPRGGKAGQSRRARRGARRPQPRRDDAARGAGGALPAEGGGGEEGRWTLPKRASQWARLTRRRSLSPARRMAASRPIPVIRTIPSVHQKRTSLVPRPEVSFERRKKCGMQTLSAEAVNQLRTDNCYPPRLIDVLYVEHRDGKCLACPHQKGAGRQAVLRKPNGSACRFRTNARSRNIRRAPRNISCAR